MEYTLVDLATMHPNLEWMVCSAALVAVCEGRGFTSPYHWRLTTESIPGFGSDEVELLLDPRSLVTTDVSRVQRTYPTERLIEFAAIALAGLALYHAGRHEIRDVALRGTGADYLVDEANQLLEVAGRSRRSDLEVARKERVDRLSLRGHEGFYVFVAEFETSTASLEYYAT